MSHANIVCSRRVFLAAIPGVCAAASATKGTLFPSSVIRYADPTTEFPDFRLTNPEHSSVLPPHYSRAVSRKGNFLVFASDASGSMQAYRLDLKSGQARVLTDAENFDPACFTLLADERSFCYVDGGRLYSSGLTSLRPRPVYQSPEGYQPAAISVTEDGLAAALVERKGASCRLQLIRMMDGMAATLVEAEDAIAASAPRVGALSPCRRRLAGQPGREAELSPEGC
jgi:hypothetical protein